MKKILTGIVSTGLALTLGILGVSAASGSGQNAAVTERDRDGSCDYREDNESPLKGSGAHCGWQENSQPGTDQENSGQGRGIQHRRGR